MAFGQFRGYDVAPAQANIARFVRDKDLEIILVATDTGRGCPRIKVPSLNQRDFPRGRGEGAEDSLCLPSQGSCRAVVDDDVCQEALAGIDFGDGHVVGSQKDAHVVDGVLDTVAGELFGPCVAALRTGGSLCLVGAVGATTSDSTPGS